MNVRPQTETRGRAALALAASLLMALPALAQASRTRPPDHQPSSSGSSTAVRPAPSSSSSSAGDSRPRGDSGAVDTRPSSGSGGGATVIEGDTRTRRYDGRHHGGRGYYGYGHYGHYGYYDPWYWYPYRFGWWLGYYGWGDPYYGRPYPGGPYEARAERDWGALDLDLKPGDVKIYVDGRFVGTADDYDGWPQYLWVEEGDHHFIFYKEGYRSIVREYRVLPGVVIDVEDRLERGESPPPEELYPPPTARRDARVREDAEQRRRAAEGESGDWRERRERVRVEREEGEFGSLALTVQPADASVYLDGRFLGTGEELARMRRGLTVDAGEHVLSVVRPGHEPAEREFSVEPGEQVRLEVTLEAN